MRGSLVVLEGIDGCGKTTQAGLLEAALSAHRKVVRLREPGGTVVGERIRELLADPSYGEMTPRTELLLFMAARAQLAVEKIEPALRGGFVVLLDRYYHSTAAYQGGASGLGVSKVLDLVETLKFPKPDLVVLLDLDPAEAAKRSNRAPDRIEAKGADYQWRVRSTFLKMARDDRKRFRIVDASPSPEKVHEAILKVVRRVL
ncbi:MAG TPA: dTMP kinase [Planctomycetota bacterium]